MIDWYGNRSNERYTYRRVSWETWQEGEEYGNIVSGELSLSAASDLRATAQFEYRGGGAPDTVDLVRIYYSFEDDYGESTSVCLGTFFVNVSTTDYSAVYEYSGGDMVDTGVQSSGTVECSSVLKVPLDMVLGVPLTVPSGTNAVEWVKSYIEALGLRTSATDSAYTTSASYTFDAGTCVLTMLNTVLGWASFAAMRPDAYGNIVLGKYIAPTKRQTVFTFRNDSKSIIKRSVERYMDLAETPNVVRLTYMTDDEYLYATASNTDTLSDASLPNRGNREVTYYSDVYELSGDTRDERVQNLVSQAVETLVSQSAHIEYLTIEHAFVPISMGDSVEVLYSDLAWKGSAYEMTVELSPSTQSSLRLRSFVAGELTVRAGGGVLWAL